VHHGDLHQGIGAPFSRIIPAFSMRCQSVCAACGCHRGRSQNSRTLKSDAELATSRQTNEVHELRSHTFSHGFWWHFLPTVTVCTHKEQQVGTNAVSLL